MYTLHSKCTVCSFAPVQCRSGGEGRQQCKGLGFRVLVLFVDLFNVGAEARGGSNVRTRHELLQVFRLHCPEPYVPVMYIEFNIYVIYVYI